MIAVFFSLMGVSLASTWILFQRQESLNREIDELVPAARAAADEPFLAALRRFLRQCGDRELFAAVDGRTSLARRGLPVREGQDPYADVGVLLRHLSNLPLPEDFVGLERRVKGVYQLAAALDADEASLQPVLECLAQRLCTTRYMDVGVATVEFVSPGDAVDRATMWPLGPGARVARPLGVIARSRDGRLLSRAKVLCEDRAAHAA